MVKFYMLIGLPGSGKTEIANRLADANTIVLSSDAIRKEFYGDEAVQDNPSKVFEEMQRRTIAALKDRKNVVYDATNISRKKRKHLVSSLSVPCKKVACVIWARYETCLSRDGARNRNVGENVIKRMLMNFQPPYYDEGWDEIRFELNDTPYLRSDYDGWIDCEHDNPHHNNSVKEHTLKVMSEAVKLGQGRSARKGVAITLILAASLHDIGKKFVKGFKNSRGEPSEIAHFYNHQNVGSYFAIGYEETLGLNAKQRALIYWLINVHMDPFLHTKYSAALTDELSELLNIFHSCDVAGA